MKRMLRERSEGYIVALQRGEAERQRVVAEIVQPRGREWPLAPSQDAEAAAPGQQNSAEVA